MGKKKKPSGIVYSTNPDYNYEYDDPVEQETLAAEKQLLQIHLEKKHRAGKIVSIIKGFIGTNEDLQQLGKTIKNKCGTGGSVKDGEIIIQGDKREQIIKILTQEGYKTKRVGG